MWRLPHALRACVCLYELNRKVTREHWKRPKRGEWPQIAHLMRQEPKRMTNVTDYPLLVLVLSFFVLWLSTRIGAVILRRRLNLGQEMREDFGVILAATLTLLGLIIGFSFSMATSRYDQRKNLEEAEANAIGTEYVRADLLPSADAVKVRALIRNYLDQRVLFYTTRDDQQLRQIDARTAQLQTDLWSAVLVPAAALAHSHHRAGRFRHE
jgi:hypothetical protein